MKTRTHFGHRIDMLDREGQIIEHLAGVEDSRLADATYEAALRHPTKESIRGTVLSYVARTLFPLALSLRLGPMSKHWGRAMGRRGAR